MAVCIYHWLDCLQGGLRGPVARKVGTASTKSGDMGSSRSLPVVARDFADLGLLLVRQPYSLDRPGIDYCSPLCSTRTTSPKA